MSQNRSRPDWWELHLKSARGEQLTELERQHYEAEMARQDQSAPTNGDIEALKRLRAEVLKLSHENDQLRERITGLEAQVATVERSLSGETKRLLGVSE